MPRTLRSCFAIVCSLAVLSAAIAWQASTKSVQPAPDLVVKSAPGPNYWKGNLHTHSLWSDGDDFPEMIADWYKRNGYNFLTLSDHNVLSEGQKWIDVAPGKGTRELALKKYVDRFGAGWVERKKNDK